MVYEDEKWIHYYVPETKDLSKQLISSGGQDSVLSTAKVMASGFWDSYGFIVKNKENFSVSTHPRMKSVTIRAKDLNFKKIWFSVAKY